MKRIVDVTNNGIWKIFYKNLIQNFGGTLIFDINLGEHDIEKISNGNIFFKDILNAWCKINNKEQKDLKTGKYIIWNIKDIKNINGSFFYRQWYEKGIKYLEHCFDYRSNEFYTFDQIKLIYNIDDRDF